VKIFFVAATLNKAVMLRHEASATDETEASYLSTTKVYKKIGTKNGAIVSDAPLKLLSSN